MAVSANSDYAPTVDEILRMALQYAGLLPLGREPTAQVLAHARNMMDMFFKSLSSDGPALYELERTTLTTVAGTAEYALAADTIEVNFPLMVAGTGQTSQTQIERMTYTNYQEIADKTQAGQPLRAYVEKLALVTVVLWPVPNQVYTISYQRQRLMRNAESGTTVDRPPRWMRGIAFQMAADMALAASLDLNRVKYFQGMADSLLARAHGRDGAGNDLSFYLEADY